VLLDVGLPVSLAFRALHDQGMHSAPLWCPTRHRVDGMISASDFISLLQNRGGVGNGMKGGRDGSTDATMSDAAVPAGETGAAGVSPGAAPPPTEDWQTLGTFRASRALRGEKPRDLVYVVPGQSLRTVVETLLGSGCSAAPLLSGDLDEACGRGSGGVGGKGDRGGGEGGGGGGKGACEGATAAPLHVATLSGVLACVMRHFRASIGSLPLLNAPVQEVSLGAWRAGVFPDEEPAGSPGTDGAPSTSAPDGAAAAPAPTAGGKRAGRTVLPDLFTVRPETPVTEAPGMLLKHGVSALPVEDADGKLLDIFARADITLLAKERLRARLSGGGVGGDDGASAGDGGGPLTVAEVLAYAQSPPSPRTTGTSAVAVAAEGDAAGAGGGRSPVGAAAAGGLSLAFSKAPLPSSWGDPTVTPGGAAAAMASQQQQQQRPIHQPKQHLFTCTRRDSLRSVVEKLSMPGVRRLVVVCPDTRRMEGIISLSDVAYFMLQ